MCSEPIILDRIAADGQLDYRLNIPASLSFFEGHFPEFPLLPGVVQINWVMQLVDSSKLSGPFVGMRRLKFMRPILGDTEVNLSIKYLEQNKRLSFKYYDELGRFSVGQFLFGEY